MPRYACKCGGEDRFERFVLSLYAPALVEVPRATFGGPGAIEPRPDRSHAPADT